MRRRGKRHWGHALFVASIAAWLTFFGAALFVGAVASMLYQADSVAVAGATSPGVMALYAIFGIPVVLVVCFVAGVPALIVAEFLGLTKWWQAAVTGAAVGLLLAVGVIFLSSAQSNAPSDNSRILGCAVLILTGACAGVAAWASLWLDRRHSANQQPAAEAE
ncbi:MAG: hypothetical protein B7Y90_09490 [Alphaproteobacteria bacterium 32-64-14]|nr:MAG: hypothetical protein B7Y90_09490 [Alphaproteobacteria bacterium 32-64-14]